MNIDVANLYHDMAPKLTHGGALWHWYNSCPEHPSNNGIVTEYGVTPIWCFCPWRDLRVSRLLGLERMRDIWLMPRIAVVDHSY